MVCQERERQEEGEKKKKKKGEKARNYQLEKQE